MWCWVRRQPSVNQESGHREPASLALRLPGSRLVKGKFSLLVSHPECHSCSNIRWGRAGGSWGGKHSKWETILNNVIKEIVLFFLRERWGAAVGKKGRLCGPVPWVFCKKFPQTPCLWTAEMGSLSSPKVRSSKSKCCQAMPAPSPRPAGWCFHGSFQLQVPHVGAFQLACGTRV